ncbi:ArnT family glycosyltransferase [Moheibacter sediminis]|uniref:Dolichyl-phosphate-mannose-protein mannosyltransferase n=1 Tax=Moheibacter sediminis TaxID=1434700 RepID=A0A1W1YPA1_9FLAO|nr:glycosyltransferase family 39 protein [Moheibacter sediminis]SMC37641.1 Dolichyl-phosphate-mannose-protein mannosyltransferase [Moheibacter sediminis]
MKISYNLLLILCLGLFLLHLNYLYVDIMEARNFVSAREMVEDKNWIFTTMNGEPRYQKPPLPTWLSAVMGEIFGTQSVWALRFPAALSCVVLILFFFKFLRKETNDKNLSIISGLILTTSFLVLFVGKRATWDIFCYSFAFIGIYYFYLTFKSEKNNFFHFTLAGLFLGFSIMSKGPTGFYVIGAPFFLAYWLTYGFPKIKWTGWVWMGFVTGIIGFSWYGYIYLNDQETFLSIMEAESSARTNREVKPVTRYFNFPIQMGVWAVFAFISLIFPYIKKKTEFPKPYKFFFLWTIICFVLLSLVPSKKERYLFPLMIPLTATTGFYVYYLLQNQNWKNWEKSIVKFSFGLIGVVGILIPVLLFAIVKSEITFYSIAFSLFSLLIGVYLLIQTFKFDLNKAFIGMVAFVSSAMILGIPVIDSVFNNNPNHKSIITQKEMIENSGLKLYGFDAYSPEIWFKYGKVIPEIYPNDSTSHPKEVSFYLISIKNKSPEEIEKELMKLGYNCQYWGEFDDNEEKLGTKNNVDRKKMMLFKAFKFQYESFN